MYIKKLLLLIFGIILVIFLFFLLNSSEWSYIKCVEECIRGNNVPFKSCNYQMVQKFIDHGKCWWSDM